MPIHIALPTTSYVQLVKYQKPGDGLTVQGRLQIPCASTTVVMLPQKGAVRHSAPA